MKLNIMRYFLLLVLAALMLLGLHPGAYGQEGVTLDSLSDEQIKQAIESMDEANLLEIIKSAGYAIDDSQEKPSRKELVDAATALTLEQKHNMSMARGGAADRENSGPQTPIVGEEGASDNYSPSNGPPSSTAGHGEPLVEEQDNGMSMGRGLDEDDSDDEEEESPYPQAELARKHGLPDNSGFWELFKAQIASDIAPFWRVVPAPVKTFLKDQARHLKPAMVAVAGATGPMLGILSKAVAASGHGLLRLSQEMEVWSDMASKKHQARSGGGSQAAAYADGNGGYPNGDSWWVDEGVPEVLEL